MDMPPSNALRLLFLVNVGIFTFALARYFLRPPYNVQVDYTGVKKPVSKVVVKDYRELNADCAHYQTQLSQKDNQISSLKDQLLSLQTQKCDPDKVAPTTIVPKTINVPPTKIGEDVIPNAEYQVPNIVHFIWYNKMSVPIKFHHMISMLSVFKNIKPNVIYFHTNNPPNGTYWERVKTSIPILKIVKRDPPETLFGEKLKGPFFYTSYSNVDRLKVLMEYGGIYMDFDVFATKSFDELRKHVCTIGFESEKKSCGSVIVASKQSFFLYLWINSYLDDYKIEEWAYNTGQVPFNLARRYPHLVHIETAKINRPNFNELHYLYGNNTFNWRDNYAVHTWYRLWKEWSGMFKPGMTEPNEDNVKTLNNTFGQIVRDVLYGTTELMH